MVLNVKLKEILIAFLDQQTIVASWGITHIKADAGSIRFSVNGMKYKGTVTIIPFEEGVMVELSDRQPFVCNSSEIVAVLDRLIECSEDYQVCLKNWFVHML